jgi:ABC-type branched-subunit amino acid transport system substrate-binding protein
VALVIVLILWPDPSGQPAPNSARPVYSIAVIGDYGPEGKAVSTTAYNSVRLALRQASPQTAPYRVEVAKYSEPGTSRGLARLAGKLTADHRTVAVIGPVGRFESAVMEEASAIFDSHRMPLVSPKARLTGELSSTTFQLAGAAEAMERKTVAYLLSAANRPGGIHQILYVSDGEDWSVKRTGRMISETRDVRSGSMAVSEPDGRSAREVADHALGERFDAVYFTGESRDFEKLDAALDTAGYRGLRMVEEVSVRTDYQVRANWLATTDECGPLARFDDPYKKRFGHAAELGGAETYDAVNAVLAALGRTERRSVPAARSRISRQLDHGEAVHGLCRPDLRFGRDGRAIDAPLFVNQYFWGFSGVDKYQLIGEIGGRAMRDLDLGKLR